jgi:hypothetical protein
MILGIAHLARPTLTNLLQAALDGFAAFFDLRLHVGWILVAVRRLARRATKAGTTLRCGRAASRASGSPSRRTP